MRFRPEQHLRRQNDIRAVRERGRRLDCRAFTVWWKRRDVAPETSEPAPAPVAADPVSAPALATAGSPSPAPASPAAPARCATPRVCVIASTAAVGHAVLRNRAKRRLREVFRQQQHLIPADCDLLLIARAAATTTDLRELERRFGEACAQISKS